MVTSANKFTHQPVTKLLTDVYNTTWMANNIICERKSMYNTGIIICYSWSIADICKFSFYWRLARRTGWGLPFTLKIRPKHKITGEVTAVKLANALTYWTKVVQRQCFTKEIHTVHKGILTSKDSTIARFHLFIEDGLVCLGGTLQFADLQ